MARIHRPPRRLSLDRISPVSMIPRESTAKSIIPTEIIERRHVLPRTVTFAQKLPAHVDRRRSLFEEIPYDLTEIDRAEDTEMYLSKSFQEHAQLMLREGFSIKSQDAAIEMHVTKRVKEIEILTGQSYKGLIRQVVRDLIRYSNAYIVKSRVDAPNSGKPYRFDNVGLNPIVGLFAADPTTVQILRNQRGQIKLYKQWIPLTGAIRFWERYDVIHIRYNRKTSEPYGTPWVVPVLDDIRILRRFEEHADILGGNFAQPFIIWKIGTDNLPMMVNPDTGDAETTIVKREIERLQQEGIAIVSHRHNPEALDTRSSGINLVPYMEYLKNRVTAGLGLNTINMGDGSTANRATATQLMQVGINRCKDLQEVVADHLNSTLMFELYLDSKQKFSMSKQAYIEFAEIDEESQRSKETHSLAMFQGGLLTHPEARIEMNRNPFEESDKEEDIIAWEERKQEGTLKLEKELSLDPQIEAQMQVAKMKPAPTSTAGGGGKSNGSTKATTNRNQPQNQHGTKSTKTKVRKNDVARRLDTESTILVSTLVNNWESSDVITETLKVYLDKVRTIADSFVRGSVKDFCIQEALTALTNDEMNTVVTTALDQHLNGNLTKFGQRCREACKDRNTLLDAMREINEEVHGSFDRLGEQLEEELLNFLPQGGPNA